MRYSKLMQAMGMPTQPELARPTEQDRNSISPEQNEAITGEEHPELQQNRQIQKLIDLKISQLENSDDPNALESLNFWKQKRDSLSGN